MLRIQPNKNVGIVLQAIIRRESCWRGFLYLVPMNAMDKPEIPSAGRAAFILVIWPEEQTDDLPLWRGALESGHGVRKYFRSLNELNRLLSELGGWVDESAARSADGRELQESKEKSP